MTIMTITITIMIVIRRAGRRSVVRLPFVPTTGARKGNLRMMRFLGRLQAWHNDSDGHNNSGSGNTNSGGQHSGEHGSSVGQKGSAPIGDTWTMVGAFGSRRGARAPAVEVGAAALAGLQRCTRIVIVI